MYLGRYRCHYLLKSSPIFANVYRFNQLIHQLISLKGKSVLEFLSVMEQPSFRIEEVAFYIDTTVKFFFERSRCTIAEHSVHTGIVQGIVALQESFLDKTVGYYPVRGFPVGSHRKEVGYILGCQGQHLPSNTAS